MNVWIALLSGKRPFARSDICEFGSLTTRALCIKSHIWAIWFEKHLILKVQLSSLGERGTGKVSKR